MGVAIGLGQELGAVRNAAAIADAHRLQNIAEIIYRERHSMKGSRIRQLSTVDLVQFAFVIESQFFARMSKENRVPVLCTGLQRANRIVVLICFVGTG